MQTDAKKCDENRSRCSRLSSNPAELLRSLMPLASKLSSWPTPQLNSAESSAHRRSSAQPLGGKDLLLLAKDKKVLKHLLLESNSIFFGILILDQRKLLYILKKT